MRENGKRTPRRIGDVLNQVIKSAPWARRGELKDLAAAWIEAAGPEVAERSRVAGLNRGRLTIYVESATLRHEIEAFRKFEILPRMKEAYTAKLITSLRCVLRS